MSTFGILSSCPRPAGLYKWTNMTCILNFYSVSDDNQHTQRSPEGIIVPSVLMSRGDNYDVINVVVGNHDNNYNGGSRDHNFTPP